MESILIKVKALNTCNVNINYGIELRKFIQKEFQLSNFTNSAFFTINSNLGDFQRNKYYFFRLVILKKEEENIFAKTILKNKISNKKYKINKLSFSIDEIIYKDSVWAFSYNSNTRYPNKIKLVFQSPCLIKLGSRYLEKLDKKYFFIKAISNYNKYLNKDFNKFKFLKEIDNIKFQGNLSPYKIKYKESEVFALRGEIDLEIFTDNEDFLNKYSQLIETIKLIGLGDRLEDGMGQIKLETK